MGFVLITAPATEPVTLAEAKLQLKVETADTADDNLITSLITAARMVAEEYTWRPLITQTWELRLDQFDEAEYKLKTPAISITSVKYIDTNGVEQTLSSGTYQLLTGSEPHRVALNYGECWPVVRGDYDGCKIRFSCGYGAAAAVPASIKQAILMMIGHWYENRQDVIAGRTATEIPMNSKYLLDPYRLVML
jgi:uncharacterized phiE125 gp8 family phage protein